MSKVRIISATDENVEDPNVQSNIEHGFDDKKDDDQHGIVLKVTSQEDDEGEELQIAVYRLPESREYQVVKVVPLPHARSEIWSYFGFVADNSGEIQDRKKVICKVCATTLSYSGNTTNLFTHLKSMHPEANPQKMPPTNKTPWKGKRKRVLNYQGTNSESRIVETDKTVTEVNPPDIENNVSLNIRRHPIIISKTAVLAPAIAVRENQQSKNYSSDDITNAIVDVIVQDFRPVSMVEGKGFQSLLKLIAPSYQIPDTQKLSQLVDKKYEAMKQNLLRTDL